jgi:DNA invertase Pin-like site-specific DNA recombinase
MDLRSIRAELLQGRSLYDLPLRVTFYARVSTETQEQRSSLEHQIQYYSELICGKSNWSYVPGYIDEGISGTSTKGRESFLRMISDAKAGRFDFIITKEISRFSRNTLDSIRYTQELLEHQVGVLFQNDGINTLDTDSEFRLVVMAGVAQDEVRKLSERLKFGFRQSIRNGRVLGNDKLWGYDKRDCALTINETEAQVVRLIFDLYANQGLGLRRLSQQLYELGHTSRMGNVFNVRTLRNILTNPKYKGWYCGNKTQSLDYRSKKKILLDEGEWITYPDPTIPAIVPEALWDRANALYKARSAEMKRHQKAATFHNRYPYSGKLICEAHRSSYYRHVLTSSRGSREVWQCSVYRQRGRTACMAPQLQTVELDAIMADLFVRMSPCVDAIIGLLLPIIRKAALERQHREDPRRLEAAIAQLYTKKDRLLELSIAGAMGTEEFRRRNEGFNQQLLGLEERLARLAESVEPYDGSPEHLAKVEAALRQELGESRDIHPSLAITILDHMTVKTDSTKASVHLDVTLRDGGSREVRLLREKSSFRFLSS